MFLLHFSPLQEDTAWVPMMCGRLWQSRTRNAWDENRLQDAFCCTHWQNQINESSNHITGRQTHEEAVYIYIKKNQTNNQKNLMPQRTMGTRSMGASRKREVDSELNKEGVVEVREVVKRIEQFNHNHLGWITGARSTRLKIARERERD